MKRRFILYRRKRGGMFYVEETETHKQESTGTRNRAEATALLNARNESVRQPQLNLQIAKAYLAGTDSGVSTRTWQDAFNAIIENKTGVTKERWQRGARQKAFDLIHPLIIVETQAKHLLTCMKAGAVSTNILLRELHNFCISMNWLAWPIIPRRLWPKFEYKPKRAITAEEHRSLMVHSVIEATSSCFLDGKPLRRAFFRFQKLPMVFVASSSHSRSASSAISSTALKNFTAFGLGRPSARNLPALTRIATSSCVQLSNFATCPARSRAGKSFAAQVVIAAGITSLFII
jgi:hypothetical protein